MRWAVVLLVLLADFSIFAQIGGPYPGGGYPPGGYPPGRYPGGTGTGLPPLPRRKQKKTTTAKDAPEPLLSVTGTLRRIDQQYVVLEAKDTRILNLKRSDKTKFLKNSRESQPSDFKPGDHLLVEATQDNEGFLYAVNVIFQKEGTAEEQAAAAQPVRISTQASENDDERPVLRRKDSPPRPDPDEEPQQPAAAGPPEPRPAATQPVAPSPEDELEPPPVLRRGGNRKAPKPREVAAARPAPASAPPAAARPAAPEPAAPATETVPAYAAAGDPVIEKARAAAGAFTQGLPNYVCQELMARFVNTSHTVNWQPLDVISTEVVYENGRERYRNVAINGKPTKKGIEDLPGAWSTGEFGTVLVDVFSPATAADFRFRAESKAGGQTALVYDFDVEQENSHWRVQVPSQTVIPAYKGAVWIDKNTHSVLRIEMQARNMPRDFPLDKVESAVDYQYVTLGGVARFLLPVHAEALSCQRGTSICSRNTIDFRNYHKYTSDSEIIFTNK